MNPIRYALALLFFALLLATTPKLATAQDGPQGLDAGPAFGWATPFTDAKVSDTVPPFAMTRGGPGSPDATFGTDGIAEFVANRSMGLLFQPDGKILVAGRFGLLAAVFRFNPDGTPDTSFGSTGTNYYAVADLGPGTFDTFNDIALQQDGKIVATGGVIIPNTEGRGDRAAVVRFNPDGTVDESFGTDGLVFEPGTLASDTPDLYRDVHVRSDGRIIAGGHRGLFSFDGDEDKGCYAVQYLLDGSRDPDFGTDGIASVAPDLDMSCENGVLMDDGRYVLGALIEAGPPVWAAVRLLADGTPDPTFGTDGLAQTTVQLNIPNGIAVGPDGSVTLAGSNLTPITTLVRFAAYGKLDSAFGINGITQIVDMGISIAWGVSLQSDGKALVTGGGRRSEPLAPFLARVLPDGTIDPSFGTAAGFTRFYEQGSDDSGWGWSVSLDAEDRIVVAGEDNFASPRMAFVARFENDLGVATEPSAQPGGLALHTPHPNPATEHTALAYTLADAANVRLALYDVLGREVGVLAEGTRPAGEHEAALDASGLAPGLYLVRLTAGDETATRHLTVVR